MVGAALPEIRDESAAGRRRVHPNRDCACVGGVGDESEVAQHVGRYHRHRLAVHLDAAVERAHARLAQAAAEQRECRDHVGAIARHACANEGRGLVGRKEVAVVGEGDQVVLRQQAVGAVAVHDVHAAGVERLVLDRRRQRAHVAWRDAIHAAQAGQPVGPADEVGGEAGGELRARRGQIGQRVQPVALGGLPPHGDRVRVLEAEGRQPAHAPAFGEGAGDVRVDVLRVGGERVGERVVEHGDQAGAGVLRDTRPPRRRAGRRRRFRWRRGRGGAARRCGAIRGAARIARRAGTIRRTAWRRRRSAGRSSAGGEGARAGCARALIGATRHTASVANRNATSVRARPAYRRQQRVEQRAAHGVTRRRTGGRTGGRTGDAGATTGDARDDARDARTDTADADQRAAFDE